MLRFVRLRRVNTSLELDAERDIVCLGLSID
jgi:hypothetical protein